MDTVRWGVRAEKGQLVELIGDQDPSPEAPHKCKRGKSKGEVRRVRLGVSGSLRGRRSEEKSQLNISSHGGYWCILSPSERDGN